ncbi:CsbD family protein [Diaphorobacter caeni]|uniref:CsbD family protein n=1 Tax=Diaphorobacter caeni TaxID=2784387 RepID=UPI00188E7636|nr:CsbD family protein [Diaphorobacter caeni]MBF5007542.1 CsbD family protein [Diaphorobacter caeni]
MKKEQVTGRVEEAKGAIKETVGKVTGNTKMQVEGNIEKNLGKAEAAAGDLANKVEKTLKK